MDLSNDSVLLTEVQLEHQNDNTQHNKGTNHSTEETNSNDDNYSIFKPKILAAIGNIKGKKKCADVDSVYNLISRTEPTNINKKSIRDFLTKLIEEKLITKKQTTQGYESYHNLSAELHTPYPPRYSIQTPTKDNPIETSECGIQTELFHNNLYVKNDVFDAFYDDYIQYKEYMNDIINTLITKENPSQKQNSRYYDEKVKLLEKQITELKKENCILKEILSSKPENSIKHVTGNKIIEKTNLDHTWHTVRKKTGNYNFNNKNSQRFISTDIRNKYQPLVIDESENEEHIISDTIPDYNQQDNTIIHVSNNNITTRKRRPTPVVNQYPERDTLGINFKNQYKNVTPGNNNFNEAVRYGRKTYVLGTSMVKGIRRNEFNSHLRKCNTRFRPFIGATVKQMETYVQPIVCDDTLDSIILHIGCNDISNRSMSANDIAEGIIKVGKYCKEHNVNYVAISSLICRSQFHLQQKINAVNTMLKNRCELLGLGFIDNGHINEEH